jgi:prepilin-type processing-associated H-X9-DG protein
MRPAIRDASVRDGLANTVAVSEYCRTLGSFGLKGGRTIFQLGSYSREQFNNMITDCMNESSVNAKPNNMDRGLCWGYDGLRNTSYDHNIRPNGPACAAQGAFQGAWTASSYHANGVNCVQLDGHVVFMKDSVAQEVWRALGTMNGGEIVSDSH